MKALRLVPSAVALVIFAACLPVAAPGPSTEPTSAPPQSSARPSPSEPLRIPVHAARTPLTVAYYRIRVELSTTSDWSALDLSSNDILLSRRVVNGNAALTTTPEGNPRMLINQPISDATSGKSATATVELAIADQGLGRTLDMVLRRGSLNATVLRVSRIAVGSVSTLLELTHRAVTPGDGTNPRSIGLSKGTLGQPTVITITPRDKLLLAFYYPWYHFDSWSSPQLMDHPLTSYDSSERATIEGHVDQARWAGIDGFISSWWGPDDYTDRNLKTLLAVAAERSFKVAPYLETLAADAPRAAGTLEAWLDYFIGTYREEPALMRLNGKPLIVVWVSFTVPLETWRTIFANLRARGRDASYLALGFDAGPLEVFDGLHQYGAAADLATANKRAGREVRYYQLLQDDPVAKIWAPSVEPGYDDHRIPGRKGSVQERNGGQFYRQTWDAALASDPDWIFITSWNEWWENTYIEPGPLFGETYLEITREFALRWKSS